MHGFVVVLVLVVLTSAALVVALDASRRHMDGRKEERVMFQWITHNGRGEREVFDLHALTSHPMASGRMICRRAFYFVAWPR